MGTNETAVASNTSTRRGGTKQGRATPVKQQVGAALHSDVRIADLQSRSESAISVLLEGGVCPAS